MVNKPVSTAPPDDLKTITGIGPAIEQQLYQGGISTFAQLAALSPAEAAELVKGVSAQRIAAQGWIEQAKAMAPQAETMEAPQNPMPEEEPPPPETPLDGETGLAGTLQLQPLVIVPPHQQQAHGSLYSGQAFGVQLVLDLSQVTGLGQKTSRYQVTLSAKNLTTNVRQALWEDLGTVTTTNALTFDMADLSLPAGFYRLAAIVTLSSTSQKPDLIAGRDDTLLQIY